MLWKRHVSMMSSSFRDDYAIENLHLVAKGGEKRQMGLKCHFEVYSEVTF